MNWSDLISSAVIAAIVSGIVAFLTAERRLASENVIQERAKWREDIRDLADQIYRTIVSGAVDADQFGELRAKLALRLNPHDQDDQGILALIVPGDSTRADEFNQRVALLLKHDWERARREANLWLLMFTVEPKRLRFQKFRPGKPHSYRRWAVLRVIIFIIVVLAFITCFRILQIGFLFSLVAAAVTWLLMSICVALPTRYVLRKIAARRAHSRATGK
jgi:hypothetical protein